MGRARGGALAATVARSRAAADTPEAAAAEPEGPVVAFEGRQGPSLPVPDGNPDANPWLTKVWREDRVREPELPLYHESFRGETLPQGGGDHALIVYDGPRYETWRLFPNGPLHREDGPALIATDEDGARIEYYCEFGQVHRKDAPAVIETRPDGTWIESYCEYSKYHRKAGPAIVETRPDGTRSEQYYDGGRHALRVDDLPGTVLTAPDGAHTEKYYSRDGQLHRTDAPALVKGFADGSSIEIYYRQGKRHRVGGPAVVSVSADGERSEQFFLHGVKCDERSAHAAAHPPGQRSQGAARRARHRSS